MSRRLTCLFLLLVVYGLTIWAQIQLNRNPPSLSQPNPKGAVAGKVFAGALGLALVLVWLGTRLAPAEQVEEAGSVLPIRSKKMELVLALMAFAVAYGFRAYRIDTVPGGISNDTGWYSLYAIDIRHGLPYEAYNFRGWGYETFYQHCLALVQGFLGYTTLAPKFTTACFSAILILIFYFFMRAMFSPAMAIVGTFILGSSGYELTFSRSGWRAATMAPMEMLATWALWKAYKAATPKARLGWYFLTGLGTALVLNTYNASRSYPLILLIFWLFLLIREGRGFLSRNWRGIILFAITFAIFISPLAWAAYHNWRGFMGRFSALDATASESKMNAAWSGVWEVFNYNSHGDDFFKREPLLDLPLAILFPLGLIFALRYAWRPKYFLLLIFFLVAMLPGLASLPNGNRVLGTIPSLHAFAALFLVFSVCLLQQILGKRSLVWIPQLALAGVLVWGAVVCYQRQLGNSHRLMTSSAANPNIIAGQYARTLARQKYFICFDAAGFSEGMTAYMAYPEEGMAQDKHYYAMVKPDDMAQFRVPQPYGVAFFIQKIYPDAIKAVQRKYPHYRLDTIYDPAKPQVVLYVVLIVDRTELDGQLSLQLDATIMVHPNDPKGALHEPSATTLGLDQDLLVADRASARITKYSPEGAFLFGWEVPRWKKTPPTGISLAVDQTGMVYAADGLDNQLLIFSPVGSSLSTLPEIFRQPVSVTVDRAKDLLYVGCEGDSTVRRMELPKLRADIFTHGLWATYYHSADWTGPIISRHIETHLNMENALDNPISILWQGEIEVPAAGEYTFEDNSDDRCSIVLDGNYVVDKRQQPQPGRVAGKVNLTAGRHQLELRYTNTVGGRGFSVLWQPPGQAVSRDIPADVLFPGLEPGK